ncbi:unnamed protein product [Protopolystoma xenopodis]|uniref:Protein kinase domain-containing protein n=1 Tax=Protopolystoma xenopodis TaxID=117903 RepID=A0A448WZC8_9PLAT|nr:unnamed protein product [Protopolystoma xenopodis]
MDLAIRILSNYYAFSSTEASEKFPYSCRPLRVSRGDPCSGELTSSSPLPVTGFLLHSYAASPTAASLSCPFPLRHNSNSSSLTPTPASSFGLAARGGHISIPADNATNAFGVGRGTSGINVIGTNVLSKITPGVFSLLSPDWCQVKRQIERECLLRPAIGHPNIVPLLGTPLDRPQPIHRLGRTDRFDLLFASNPTTKPAPMRDSASPLGLHSSFCLPTDRPDQTLNIAQLISSAAATGSPSSSKSASPCLINTKPTPKNKLKYFCQSSNNSMQTDSRGKEPSSGVSSCFSSIHRFVSC